MAYRKVVLSCDLLCINRNMFSQQNSPGGLFVLRVSATDEDLGSNAKITYTLEGNDGHYCLL